MSSLKEKLVPLSKNLEEEKKINEKIVKDKELEPIRTRIQKLEHEYHQLDIIQGSLQIKSDKNLGRDGLGMQEYAFHVDNQLADKTGEIDQLVQEHREALATRGIQNGAELMASPEFAGDDEVVSYKKAAVQKEEVKLSDQELISRLEKMGISSEPDEFSYKEASRAIEKKLLAVEAELLQEKLKTPEGREEATDKLASDFEKVIPRTILSYDQEKGCGEMKLGDSYPRSEIEISGEKIKFLNWEQAQLIPVDLWKYGQTAPENELTRAEIKYGQELARTALERAYQNDINKTFSNFDKEHDNVASLKQQMERISPREARKTEAMLREFMQAQNEFRSVLETKAQELAAKGVKFSSKVPVGYGGSYEELIKLDEYHRGEDILNELERPKKFPPEFDYQKLQEHITERTASLKKFMSAVGQLETEKDVNGLLTGKKTEGSVSELHAGLLRNRLNDSGKNDFRFRSDGQNHEAIKRLLEKCHSFSDTEKYLNNREEDLSVVKAKVLEKIKDGVRARLKGRDLNRALEESGLNPRGARGVENMVSNLEMNKRAAEGLLQEIWKLETKLPPNEQLVLSGAWVSVLSVQEQIKKLAADKVTEEESLKELQDKVRKHYAEKPKLFGKDKWQSELDEMEKRQKDLKIKIDKMGGSEYNDLLNKSNFYITVPSYYSSAAEDILKKQKSQGTAQEIFHDLRGQLEDLTEQTLPENINSLYQEYKALEKKLP